MLLVTGVTQIAAALTTLNTTLGDVKVKADILSSNLSALKTDIDTAIGNAGCPGPSNCPDTTGVDMGFDTNDVSTTWCDDQFNEAKSKVYFYPR